MRHQNVHRLPDILYPNNQYKQSPRGPTIVESCVDDRILKCLQRRSKAVFGFSAPTEDVVPCRGWPGQLSQQQRTLLSLRASWISGKLRRTTAPDSALGWSGVVCGPTHVGQPPGRHALPQDLRSSGTSCSSYASFWHLEPWIYFCRCWTLDLTYGTICPHEILCL